jgi:ATP-dependent exoDNAse (exonuclease V) alpha subunit
LAIYHLRLKVHSRSLGHAPKPGGPTRRSAIAAAAYRSGERLYDNAQGRWFAYDKPDVVHTEIMAPGDDVPAWVFNRQMLWNAVERAEKRIDAQLCREVELTLPRELSTPARIDLVRGFVRDEFLSRGMVADFAIHAPGAADGREQPHAHILLSLRRLDPTTSTGFSSKKAREWNDSPEIARLVDEARKKFNDTGLETDMEALRAAEALRPVNIWRKAWMVHANRALELAGSEARIDHRTLEAQGIFRMPQISLGIARHINKAYDYVRERVTRWVSIHKRADLFNEAEHLRQRDPAKLADFVLRLSEMAESFAASFRKEPEPDLATNPEVDLER